MEKEDVLKPTDINKAPETIKEAQKDIGKLDVLVCGICHDVFHYVEEFQEHRLKDNCTGISIIRENNKNESKPQVWGFMLWKNAQSKQIKEEDLVPTQWMIYQSWCNLSPEQKKYWVTAGGSIQAFTKLSTAKLQEVNPQLKNKVSKRNNLEEDHSKDEHVSSNSQKTKIQASANKESIKRQASTVKEGTTKLAKVNNENNTAEKNNSRGAVRSTKSGTTEEAVVEKIMNKRVNPRKKWMEYLVKWENKNESENTWEPRVHFEKCKYVLEEFDKSYSKSKIASKLSQRAADARAEQQKVEQTRGRPQRTSKQKALNQVKVWCGDITEGDDDIGKRKAFSDDDDDSSDSFEKKIKLEDDTDTSDDDKPSVTIRKIVKTPGSLNGVSKKEGELLGGQRVVRVSQKQVPNLSSGVYIMSKTDGIIKLDSNNSSGNTLLKIAPKIGQTQIRMINKDGNVIKTSAKTPPRVYKGADARAKVSAAIRRNPATIISKGFQLHDKSVKTGEEDSDGLEELDFPTDLPLPQPDSPPGEFTLCPLTGKLVGQTYEENVPLEAELENLIKIEPLEDVAVAPTPVVDTKLPTTTTIQVLAVSDVATTSTKPIATTTDLEAVLTQTAIAKIPILSSSILSQALSGAKIAQAASSKKLLSTPNTVRKKVTTTRSPANRPVMPKPSTTTTIIHRISPNKSRQVAPKVREPVAPILKRGPNVNTYKSANVAKRIGNTIIYRATPEKTNTIIKMSPIATATMPTVVPTSQPTILEVNQTQAVINMPLLSTDEAASTPENTQMEAIVNIANDTDLSTFSMHNSETPILITGEDGTIYQVAGQNEEGQTILISEGPDGQQQCLIVSSDAIGEATETAPETNTEGVEQGLMINTQTAENEMENEESQVVAQIIKADLPSPGGTRKVVLMLPDGNLMMADVTAEQYAALELDK